MTDEKTVVEGELIPTPPQEGTGGPYSNKDITTLDLLEGYYLEAIDNITEGGKKKISDEDDINKLLSLGKEIASNIHKKTGNESRHVTEGSKAQSLEAMAKYAREAQTISMQHARKDGDAPRVIEIGNEHVPDEVVPGHMEIEITRPTFKEVMDTPDEEDD